MHDSGPKRVTPLFDFKSEALSHLFADQKQPTTQCVHDSEPKRDTETPDDPFHKAISEIGDFKIKTLRKTRDARLFAPLNLIANFGA